MRKGVTLIEVLTVLAVIGLVLAIVVPRMHATPEREVRSEAYQLVNDLEVARTRAIATKAPVRVVFDVVGGAYTAYLDDDGNGAVKETPDEAAAVHGFGTRVLDASVRFGAGDASPLPDVPGTPPVTFAGARIDFDNRGLTAPFGTRGAIYLASRDDPRVAAAVSVSGAGAFRVWFYRNGSWQ